ncbi:glycosyltransferase [Aneurinibacillus migulanus]|uniref:Glycosyltransferase involved in cell wall bisynthesis n=1 Tax=Aneurinibacillus migulanus TaxID=47500 RepID=A0A0D1W1U8_ANEMI|nr:glycosyltransferase [Aneurinibacillus migulanus]KIV52440.1 hypothetical protein TS65_23850 [Aneurinibacillus migulanus]KON94616.1 hypothetical protein AF333_03025 [Aneurinibacillus migulanus]MED0892665.1 glycosyltransferase [Aneurinibacillus migulanus]MED1614306.1 glycosyltransferase [Aneurinibacillus migulanus]SDI48105.1 Glycosyltransferase involved in cell wall bisynthesis [Aneurinibacillus migulanus]
MGGKETIVMLSSVHYEKNLWQRHHHLAEQFVKKGYNVIFINHCGGIFSEESMQKNFSTYFSQHTINNGLLIIDRVDFIKKESGQLEWVQNIFLEKLLDYFSLKNPVLISYLPEFYTTIEYLKEKRHLRTFYDCVDDMSGLFNNKKIAFDEEKLLSICDGVIVTSKTLFSVKGKSKAKCTLVANAVSYENFLTDYEKPDELKKFQGPIIGYVGAIANWFDKELICQLANKHSDWNFVLVGKAYTDIACFKPYPNIHLLGVKDYAEIPAYIKSFDVGIIPFMLDNLIVNTNPIKYYEYVAAGIPVVSVLLPELIGEPYAHLAIGVDEFSKKIKQSLQEGRYICDAGYLYENSWSVRAEKVLDFLFDSNFCYKREQILENILSSYGDYVFSHPLIFVLALDLNYELRNFEKVNEMLNYLYNNPSSFSVITQLSVGIDMEKWSFVSDILRMMGIEGEIRRNTVLLKLIALRKTERYSEAIEFGEKNILDEEVMQYIGNVYFDIEDYKKALNCYTAYSNKYGTLKNRESEKNYTYLKKHLLENVQDKKIVIFGASLTGEQVINLLERKNISIKYFIDNDTSKYDLTFKEKNIYSPKQVITTQMNPDIIIISSPAYEKEMEKQLLDLGWKGETLSWRILPQILAEY